MSIMLQCTRPEAGRGGITKCCPLQTSESPLATKCLSARCITVETGLVFLGVI